ncbi:MAG TPA: tail fiber protein [Bacillota bacterium]|nr:tail fiber protein [Bacillota bacterium]
MFDYNKKVTPWEDTGTEPPEGLRKWQAGEKPPAAWWNWFWDAVQKCFEDIKNWINGHLTDSDPHPIYATDNDLAAHQHDSIYVKLNANNTVPPGVINPFSGTVAPPGWLLCYGQDVSRSTYAALFAVIGITYGSGNGSNTFNVPDFRGRTPIGKDNMGGTSANVVNNSNADILGGKGGEENHILSVQELASHNHKVRRIFVSGATGTDRTTAFHDSAINDYTYGADAPTYPIIAKEGNDQGHNNMQPWISLNWIIKY